MSHPPLKRSIRPAPLNYSRPPSRNPQPPPSTVPKVPSSNPRIKALVLTIGVASITATGAWYGASLKIKSEARKEQASAAKIFAQGTERSTVEEEESERAMKMQAANKVREKDEAEMVKKLEDARFRLVRAKAEVEGKLRGLEERSREHGD